MASHLKKNSNIQRGFSLLEVLITMIVVAIGLLGVAGMQVTSLKLAEVAQTRSVGAVLAGDILERIRANAANAVDYTIAIGATATGSATLAQRDLAAWKQLLADPLRGLPGGDGSISVTESDPASCPVVVGTSLCLDIVVTVRSSEERIRGGSVTRDFVLSSRI
jgi:type IV pilus assembly protein PilV